MSKQKSLPSITRSAPTVSMRERRGIVADGVVAEAPEVGGDRAAGRLPRLRPYPLAALEAAGQVGKRAAGVGETHLKLRQAVQHAAEHEVGGGHRRVERVAEQVMEVEGPEPLRADHRDRVQEHRQLQRLAALEEGEKRRV